MSAAVMEMLKRQDRRLALAAALILLIGSAIVHGLWTDRWANASDLQTYLNRLNAIPLEVQGWQGKVQEIENELSETAARVGIAKIARRQFVNETTGQSVSAILMCGRFGPLSVHTPDVCYGAAGYTMFGKPARVEVVLENGKVEVFWTARFHKPNAPESAPLRVYWGWNTSQGWLAPENPRWTFRMKPVLWKLYLAREMTSIQEPPEQDPSLSFLRAWLPELDKVLFE